MNVRDQILSAIIEKNNHAVLALLEKDPTLWDHYFDGETILHLIVHNNNPEMIRALAKLPQWANLVNKTTYPPAPKGIRPLMSAVWENNIDCAKAIIESGIQSGSILHLDSQTAGGHTALTNAVEKENLEMVKLILNAPHINNILNIKRKVDSKSALMIAVEKGSTDIVKAILEMPETDFDAIANQKTAAQIATEKGFTEIAEMIETAKIAKGKNIAPSKLPSYFSFLRDRRKAHTPTLFSEYLKELKAMDPSAKTTASQRAAVLARKAWSDTHSLTDQQNEKSEVQSKQEVLDRLIALGYRDNTEKVYETIIDFLQYNSAIVMSFNAGLLNKSKEQGGPANFKALNVFESHTRDAGYVKDRDEAERGLFQSLETERAKNPGITSILATEMARPVYAALMLLDRNHTIQNLGTGYGTSYLVLADHLKQSALNVPANPFYYHHKKKKDYKPSTYFHFETFLQQCSPEKLRALATRATTGQLSDEYKLLSDGEDGYITVLLPGFNFLDKNCVQHIHINPAEYTLTSDEAMFIRQEAKITLTNTEANPYPYLCKFFMQFCEGNNTDVNDELAKNPVLAALEIKAVRKLFPKLSEAEILKIYPTVFIKTLLHNFPTLTRITNAAGLEPLHIAAMKGNSSVVSALISFGKIDPNRIATGGKDALDYAIENDHTEVISAIICATAAQGSEAMFKQLLAKIKKLNNPLVNACLNATNKEGYTPLFIVANRGDKGKLNALLAFSDIDLLLASPTYGKTPEQIARDNGHDEIADLLKSRTSPEYKFIAVLKTNNLNNVKKFIQEGSIDIKNTVLPDGNSVLTFAVLNCSVEIVREIASIPSINLNHRRDDGETALSLAIKNNDFEKVKLLYETPGISFLTISEISKIAKKGSVRKYLFAKTTLENKTVEKNIYYKKAMDKLKNFAVKALEDDTFNIEPEGVSFRKIKKLNIEIQRIRKVENNTKLNATIAELKALALKSFTPKESFVSQYQLLEKKYNEFIQQQEANLYAAKKHDSEWLKNVNNLNSEGQTLLHEAIFAGKTAVAIELINLPGINLNQVNAKGDTAILVACKLGHEEIVDALLAKKIDISIANAAGETPLVVAADNLPLAKKLFQHCGSDLTINTLIDITDMIPATPSSYPVRNYLLAQALLIDEYDHFEPASALRLNQFIKQVIAGDDLDILKEFNGLVDINQIYHELQKSPPSKNSKLNLMLEQLKLLVAKAIQPEQSFLKEYNELKKEYENYKLLSDRVAKIDSQLQNITKELDQWQKIATDYPLGKTFILSHIEKIRGEAKKIENDDSTKLEENTELKVDEIYKAASDEYSISGYIDQLKKLAPENSTQLDALVEEIVLSRYSRRFDHHWDKIEKQCEQLFKLFRSSTNYEQDANRPNQILRHDQFAIEIQNAYLLVNKDSFQQTFDRLEETLRQLRKLDNLAINVANYFNDKQDAQSMTESNEESIGDYLQRKINLAYLETNLEKAIQSVSEEFFNIQSLDKLRVSTPIKNLMGICADATNPYRMAAAIILRDKILDLYQQTDKTDFYINFEIMKHEIQEFSALNSYAHHLLQIEKNYKASKTARTQSVESIKEAIAKAYSAYGPLDAKACKEQLAREVDQIQAEVKKDHQTTSKSRFLGRFQPESKLVTQIKSVQKASTIKFLSGHQSKSKHVTEAQSMKEKNHKQKK